MNDITKILRIFSDKFKPVSDISEATDFFTTQEILNSILDIDPVNELSPDELITYLEVNKYQFIPEPGKLSLHFKWMVKRLS